jgi:transposase InsO family protein
LKQGRTDEASAVHGRADHWGVEGARGRAKTADLARKHGVSEATLYNWKAKSHTTSHLSAELYPHPLLIDPVFDVHELIEAGVSRRRSAPITTRQARDHHPASDLVRRNFMAERPNELWVADITFLPTLAGFLYLAVVLDAWSRRIVGWAFSADLPRRARRSRHGAHGPKARQPRPSFG